MRNNLFVLIAGVAVTALFFGFLLACTPPAKTMQELDVKKVRGVWRVVPASSSGSAVEVHRQDTIVWTVDKTTDAYFQFPDTLFEYVSNGPPSGYTEIVKKGEKLQLIVKRDADAGIHIYSVFCWADSVFAKGESESPPRIIIL